MKSIKHRAISEFLSYQTSQEMKGVFVLMVLLSHLHGRVQLFSNSIFGTLFSASGYLAVGGFFFLSGFGLYAGLLTKKGYINSFLSRKIFPYYTLCCSVIVIYLIRDIVTNGVVDGLSLVCSFFFGKTIVDFGWYLQAQLVLYIVFYFCFRFTKHGIRWMLVVTAIYCIFCKLSQLPTTWYETIICFLIGVLVAAHKPRIFSAINGNRRKKVALLALTAALFVITLFFGNKAIFPEMIRVALKMISSVLFVVLAALVCTYISIRVLVLKKIGKLSFSVYVLQGLFLNGYRSIIENDWLYMLASIVSVFAVSVVAQPLFNRISKNVANLKK